MDEQPCQYMDVTNVCNTHETKRESMKSGAPPLDSAYLKAIGRRFKALRGGMTITDVVAKSGVSRMTINRFEKGEYAAELTTLVALSRAIECDVTALLAVEAALPAAPEAPKFPTFSALDLHQSLEAKVAEVEAEAAEALRLAKQALALAQKVARPRPKSNDKQKVG